MARVYSILMAQGSLNTAAPTAEWHQVPLTATFVVRDMDFNVIQWPSGVMTVEVTDGEGFMIYTFDATIPTSPTPRSYTWQWRGRQVLGADPTLYINTPGASDAGDFDINYRISGYSLGP